MCVRQRLTSSRKPWQETVEQRELEGEPEAASDIRKYLALADVALRRVLPFLIKRECRAPGAGMEDKPRAA